MTTKSPKKVITFIATQQKNKPVNVTFYTKNGNKVNFGATEKVPVKVQIRFKARKS